MKTKVIAIKDLNPAPYNPRIDLKKGMDEWEALNNSLGKFGLVVPVVVNERNNVIIGGHQRVSVLKSQGIKEVEAIMVDLDDYDEKELNIVLNKAEGRWDFEKLETLLSEMTPEERKFTGFLDEDIEELDVAKRSVKEPEEKEQPFDIYISFERDADIKGWLEDHGITPPEIAPVTIINMEEK